MQQECAKLIKWFIKNVKHIGELKTFIVILKSYKDDPIINDTFEKLYKKYLIIRNNDLATAWKKRSNE